MQVVYHNVHVSKPRDADDPTAIGFSISISPPLGHAIITSMLSIAQARELALKIERAADEAEAKLDAKSN